MGVDEKARCKQLCGEAMWERPRENAQGPEQMHDEQ